MVKNLLEMQETQVQYMGQEDPMEKGSHSSEMGLTLVRRDSL